MIIMVIRISSNIWHSLDLSNCHHVLSCSFDVASALTYLSIMISPKSSKERIYAAVTCNRWSPRLLESIGEVVPMRTAGHHLLCIVVAIAFVLESEQSWTAVLKWFERGDDSSVILTNLLYQTAVDSMACRRFFHYDCAPFEQTLT